MDELSIHNIKEIKINHNFVKSDNHEGGEFSCIEIKVKSDKKDKFAGVRKFRIVLFIEKDANFSIENLLLAKQHEMIPNPERKEEDGGNNEE